MGLYNQEPWLVDRRQMLRKAGAGAGLLGLTTLLHDEGILNARGADQTDGSQQDPLAPRASHFPPRAKRVIWIFVNGGPSQVDTWDHKPELEKRDGEELPGFDKFTGFFDNAVGGLMKSPFRFSPQGECGKIVRLAVFFASNLFK